MVQLLVYAGQRYMWRMAAWALNLDLVRGVHVTGMSQRLRSRWQEELVFVSGAALPVVGRKQRYDLKEEHSNCRHGRARNKLSRITTSSQGKQLKNLINAPSRNNWTSWTASSDGLGWTLSRRLVWVRVWLWRLIVAFCGTRFSNDFGWPFLWLG